MDEIQERIKQGYCTGCSDPDHSTCGDGSIEGMSTTCPCCVDTLMSLRNP
jgi:hypothetical protein